MTTVRVWTLTVDDDEIVTTVHPSEKAALQALRDNYCDGMDLPVDDDELSDVLTKPTWEGGPGVVFCIEEHAVDATPAAPEPVAAPILDPVDAIAAIRRLAAAANLAVSTVTVSDVLMLKGIDTEPSPAQTEAVLNSYEWRHWGENWADWFEGLDPNDD